MSYQTATTKFTDVKGIKLAYRTIGKQSDVPLLYLTHFRGTMDLVDPLLVDSIAKSRQVILLDYAGCGESEGTIPKALEEVASTVVDFLAALRISKVDLLGFSMGGMIAQIIAVEHTQVLRKLILAGTQSSYTEGTTFGGPEIKELAAGVTPNEEDMMKLFFFPSETSRSLGHDWWERVKERKVKNETDRFLNEAGAEIQWAAIEKFCSNPGFFERFKQISISILVTNGRADVMTPTSNSYIMANQLKNTELHIYPDSGHGHLYQFPETYAKQLELFLN
ncbi:alpha beta fold family protein [Rutstroemia sp. NJR-2017a BVV2]|nr:alpha beta fold family protein [Rutstroemia sp. NJR-2017a BVV2]